VTNGGTDPSAATKQALNTFCADLDTNSLTAKMIALNCFVPDNLIAAITPLIKVQGNDPWTNLNFVSGDITTSGLLGNNAFKYLDTGVQPANLNYADTGITAYVPGALVDNTSATWGSVTALVPDDVLQLLPLLGGTLYAFLPYSAAGASGISVANATGGYFCLSRTASNLVTFYKANSSIGHTTFGSSAFNVSDHYAGNANPFFVQALNSNGGAVQESGDLVSFLAIHTSLTAGESATFYGLVQALRTALGGGFL
jgi:hypothetical protein